MNKVKKIIIKEEQKDKLFNNLDNSSTEHQPMEDDLTRHQPTEDNFDNDNYDIGIEDEEPINSFQDDDDDEDNDEIPHKKVSEMTDEELKEYFDKLETKLGEKDNDTYDYEDEEEEESSKKLNETIGDFYERFQDIIDSVLVLLDTDDIADKRKDITEHNVKLLNKISKKLNSLRYY